MTMETASARSQSRSWWPPRIAARKRDSWFLLVAAAIAAADQVAKWVVRETIERGDSVPEGWPIKLVHVTNSGAAFGILQDTGPFLAVTSVVGMIAILVYLFSPSFTKPLMRLGLAFMLGGAAGNLIDRVTDGRVVDYIKFPEFPAFNVADSSITIGVLLLLWAMLDDSRSETTAN